MIIVNSKVLPSEPIKGHDLFKYSVEYQDGTRQLQTLYPSGEITLRRNGYPRVNRRVDGSVTLPEDAPPIKITLTTTDKSGAVWSYVNGSPIHNANGLVEPRPETNRVMLEGEIIRLDLRNGLDYAFYIYFKSNLIGTEYHVYDPEGDEIREVKRKKEEMRAKTLIWNDFDENKVKLMCEAYGISISARGKEIDVDLLRQKLEDKVFAMETEKQRDKTNLLMAKGIAEFLADAKADEFTRPKAIIQRAIDEKILTYSKSYFRMGDLEICFVPLDWQSIDKRQEYLAKYFRTQDDGEKWTALLQAVVDKDYIDACDKYGLRWLAEQVGVRLNQQIDAIKEQVYEKFGIKVEADVPSGTTE